MQSASTPDPSSRPANASATKTLVLRVGLTCVRCAAIFGTAHGGDRNLNSKSRPTRAGSTDAEEQGVIVLQTLSGCPVYQFKPRISFGNDLLLPAAMYGVR